MKRPARVVAGVAVGAVQEVAVEEEGVARLELAVDPLEPLEGGGDALGVGAGLIADRAVIDPAHLVRALQDLEASVGAGRAIDGDQATGQVGEQAAVFVPVAVILVPLPGAADPRLLEDHLVVVMVDLAAQEPLHGVDDPPAADERAVDVVAQSVADREPDDAALAVAAAGGWPPVWSARAIRPSRSISSPSKSRSTIR